MSKYRCPLCGATHKDPAERCRMCGQSMEPGAPRVNAHQRVDPVRARRGTKGLVLIGIGLVVAIGVAAVALGLVRETTQVRKAKDLVTGEADGWTTQVDEQGRYTVALPGTRTRESTAFPATDDGRITAWHAELGTDAEILVGWGKVSPTLTDGTLAAPAAYRYLRETVVPRWMAANGLPESFVSLEEGGAGGLPAVTARTTQARLKLGDQDAYGHLTFALNGTTLYVLQVRTIYLDAPQLPRLVNSFRVTGAVA
jgi:hypothetical protein